ncbi:MAG: glycosyltransferase family 2 protein [Verrucomicrobiota bacterium]|nr:glycosyltransferase family 2 protein [Verrucomicrobiota bacterium]
MKKPFLSVVIPNYNHGAYLENCLHSVLHEAVDDMEIFIIDDASTDNSLEILEKIAKKSSFITLIRNQSNKGVNASLNSVLHQIRGEYFFGLAADDFILPGFFKRALSLLKAHPHVALCCSDFAYFYKSDKSQIEVKSLIQTNEPYLILSPEKTLQLFKDTNFWIPGHTSIVRTQYLRKYGGFREKIKSASDFYLVHKIALTYPIVYIPEGLSAMRVLSSSYSAQCSANRVVRREKSQNLLNLILSDPCKKKFQQSTVLGWAIKDLFPFILFLPKYWGFLPPFFIKITKRRLRIG